jgi:hypothetical protein
MQLRISETLSTLEDKVELNRRMNNNLDQELDHATWRVELAALLTLGTGEL